MNRVVPAEVTINMIPPMQLSVPQNIFCSAPNAQAINPIRITSRIETKNISDPNKTALMSSGFISR